MTLKIDVIGGEVKSFLATTQRSQRSDVVGGVAIKGHADVWRVFCIFSGVGLRAVRIGRGLLGGRG
jgi:hypothetical protein